MKFTLKKKKEARKDLMNQVKQGWEPTEGTWALIEWLNAQIKKGEESGDAASPE